MLIANVKSDLLSAKGYDYALCLTLRNKCLMFTILNQYTWVFSQKDNAQLLDRETLATSPLRELLCLCFDTLTRSYRVQAFIVCVHACKHDF